METLLTTSIKTDGRNSHTKRHLEERHEKTWKDTKRHEKYIIKCENEYEDRGLNFTDEKTPKDTETKDMKRHELYIIKCEKTGHILTTDCFI